MKKTNLQMALLFLTVLAGVALAQYDRAQPARREDRDLVQRELRARIYSDERRDSEVQIETAETYSISRTENGIRGRARVSANRSGWRTVSFDAVIDTRRNLINNLRWKYEDNRDGRRYDDRNDDRRQSGDIRSGRYEIQLVATNRLLAAGSDGRTVVQRSGGGRSSQWDIEDAGNGYFYLRLADTGDVLTVQGRGESGDSVVLARQRRGDEGQLWLIKSGPDNGYYFTTQRDKALDSPSSARGEGGRMQIYNSNGEANQRFRLRMISETGAGGYNRDRDRNDRGQYDRDRYDRGGNRDNNYGGFSGMTWRGRVDDVLVLEIRDRSVNSRVISGRSAENVSSNFGSSLPNREATVSVEKRHGRGEVRVVEQPSRRNGYTAIIQIRDSAGGADDYEIEVRWN